MEEITLMGVTLIELVAGLGGGVEAGAVVGGEERGGEEREEREEAERAHHVSHPLTVLVQLCLSSVPATKHRRKLSSPAWCADCAPILISHLDTNFMVKSQCNRLTVTEETEV